MGKKRIALQYPRLFNAGSALDAVEAWANGCLLLRETGMFRNGRLDGLLVPSSWDSVLKTKGFYGIEVKVSRSDFLKGLQSGQFDRYLESLNGLYIATPYSTCKTSEIPSQFGHLVVAQRDRQLICVCRRHAEHHSERTLLTEEVFWRWVIDMGDQFSRNQRRVEERYRKRLQKIKDRAAETVFRVIHKMEKDA